MGEKIKMIELFSGIGAQAMAMREVGLDFESLCCEIDPKAYKSYCAIHGDTENLGDITKVEHLPECDLLFYSFPCVSGDTLVQTSEGWKEIKDIKMGDYVYTQDGYKQILKSMMTGIKETYTLTPVFGLPIRATANHKFYVRKLVRHYPRVDGKRKSIRTFSEPEYLPLEKLTKEYYVGLPIPKEGLMPEWGGITLTWSDRKGRHRNELSAKMYDENFWWTIGRYIADGWIRDGEQGICMAIGKDKFADIERIPFKYTISKEGSVFKVHISQKEIAAFCKQFGVGALNKHIPEKYKNIPRRFAKAMLDGYLSGDGCRLPDDWWAITTVSKRLALDLTELIAYIHGRPSTTYITNPPEMRTFFDGRIIHQNIQYIVKFHEDARKQDKAFSEDRWIWCPIRSISTETKTEEVYDIEVEGTHSFVANGILIHNCQDISMAGKREGFTEDSGTRSSLLWEVKRLLLDMKSRERERAYRLLSSWKMSRH